MPARFPRGKQPEFPVHCSGTRKLSNLIYSNLIGCEPRNFSYPSVIVTEKLARRHGEVTPKDSKGSAVALETPN